ncbi:MAG: hypothetical protein IJG63_03205 [Oscillospiraceae bacterium]|nr:hypothetical protein [Oscillospiraceae bacterium]
MSNNHEHALELIKGAYDLHVHSGPSHLKRSVDDFTLLREADGYGMAGALIKSHYESTASRAAIANQYAGASAKAYSGFALNQPFGGINPYAVEAAAALGLDMIWMPTRDAAWCLTRGNMKGDFFDRPGISIVDDTGKLIPQIHDVIDIVKKYNICLATGHVSPDETDLLCLACSEAGIKFTLTHPDWHRTRVPVDFQIRQADRGAIIEKTWGVVEDKEVSIEEFASSIRAVGSHRVSLTTDRGQFDTRHPADSYLDAIEQLSAWGLSDDEIIDITRTVPKQLMDR